MLPKKIYFSKETRIYFCVMFSALYDVGTHQEHPQSHLVTRRVTPPLPFLIDKEAGTQKG